ncbi:MAG: lysine 2,3-aminomutase [Candidatus Sericytochromatia bacterium]
MAKKIYYKSYSLYNYKEIPQIDRLSKEDRNALEVVAQILPFKTNNYVLDNLINWDNIPNDPIFTLNFPRKEMLNEQSFKMVEELLGVNIDKDKLKLVIENIRNTLNPHPSNQKNNIPKLNEIELKGVQHKYKETVLFFPSQGQTCHAYCTFCFRWPQFVGMNDIKFSMNEIELLINYIKENPSITDILFTGGDPLIMKSSILKNYIDALLDAKLENIQTIRIGTKSLSYWPYRFISEPDSDELLFLFEKIVKSGKNLAIMAHFNHPVELSTNEVKEAIIKIRSTGAQIRTQSPVLKNINDNPDLWSEMWRKQVNLNCIPYYMFIERDTGSKSFFEIPLEKAWEIFRAAYQNVSGVCRTVRGPVMSSSPGKIQILGVTTIKNEKVFVLRFLQGRESDWVARPFFAKYDEKATWLNHLEPAFNESNFFFE